MYFRNANRTYYVAVHLFLSFSVPRCKTWKCIYRYSSVHEKESKEVIKILLTPFAATFFYPFGIRDVIMTGLAVKKCPTETEWKN